MLRDPNKNIFPLVLYTEPPLNGVGSNLLVSFVVECVFEFAICLWMMGCFRGGVGMGLLCLFNVVSSFLSSFC